MIVTGIAATSETALKIVNGSPKIRMIYNQSDEWEYLLAYSVALSPVLTSASIAPINPSTSACVTATMPRIKSSMMVNSRLSADLKMLARRL